MKMRIPVLALAAMAVSTLSAKDLTPGEALSRAMANDGAGVAKSAAVGEMKIKSVLNMSDERPALYLFEGAGNMLVVPADDRIPPVLGYLDSSSQGEMPPQLEWWLSEYVREIEYLVSQPQSGSGVYIATAVKSQAARAPISPLVSTKWNQASPYNYLCPTVSGDKSVTGCVATAAAQVMKYHNYPESGKGTVTYTDNGVKRTLNYDGKKFDWANMLDSYNATYSSKQRDAVAYLMQAVGYASHMGYSPSASGATSEEMVVGVKQYFGYNDKMEYIYRDNYTLSDWEDLLYNQLKNVGPVYYAGTDAVYAGHAFVCDGYSSDGFFHFNWGWGGAYDGYFKLLDLVPEGQGIGGNVGGFNFDQGITVNFTKPGAPTVDVDLPSCSLYGNLQAVADGDFALRFSSDDGGVFFANSSDHTVRIDMGVKAVNMTTGEESVRGNNEYFNLASYYGFAELSLEIPANLADGDYRMYMVYREYGAGDWTLPRHPISKYDYVYVSIINGEISAVGNLPAAELSITSLSVESRAYMSKPLKLAYRLSNDSDLEIYTGLRPIFFTLSGQSATLIATGDIYAVNMTPGASSEIETIVTMTPQSGYESFSGSAYLGVMRYDGNAIEAYVPVTILKTPGELKVATTGYSFIGDSNNADANNLQFNCGFRVTGGYWCYPASVLVFDNAGYYVTTFKSAQTFFLSMAQSATTIVSGTLPDATVGSRYSAYFGYMTDTDYDMFGSPVNFKIGIPYSGVEDVTADSDASQVKVTIDRNGGVMTAIAPTAIADVEVWGIDGRRLNAAAGVNGTTATVDTTALPRGVLIVRVTLADGNTATVKTVN